MVGSEKFASFGHHCGYILCSINGERRYRVQDLSGKRSCQESAGDEERNGILGILYHTLKNKKANGTITTRSVAIVYRIFLGSVVCQEKATSITTGLQLQLLLLLTRLANMHTCIAKVQLTCSADGHQS